MTERRAVVGVAGGSGSGKTTVVDRVVAHFGRDVVTVIRHDAYYHDLSHLPAARRARVNFDHPDSLDTELLVDHLRALRAGRSVQVPVYDFETHTRTGQSVPAEPRPVVLVDGILVLALPKLREMLDLRTFVDVDARDRLDRRIERDVQQRGRTRASVVAQFETSVAPMHERFVGPSREHADLIIEGGGHNTIGVSQLIRRIGVLRAGARTRSASRA